MELELSRDALAPRWAVWKLLTAWERQPEWMHDAIAVEVLTPERTGVGVTLRCPTNLLGVRVEDVMRVTAWDVPRYLAVTHLGRVITGSGAFVLTEVTPQRTRLTWREVIDPPLGALGEWGAARFARPALRVVFGSSLAGLASLAEREVSLAGRGR